MEIKLMKGWRLTNEAPDIYINIDDIDLENMEEEQADLSEYTGLQLTGQEIDKIARRYSNVVHHLDSLYNEVKLSSFIECLAINGVSKLPYTPNVYDCENYAFQLWSDVQSYYECMPFGIVHVVDKNGEGGHMLNCAYVEGQWYWVEPQSDRIYTQLDGNYKVKYIQI